MGRNIQEVIFNIVWKLSRHNYNAVKCAFLMCLYKNKVVDDILDIILGDKKSNFLKDNFYINCMEGKQKKHLRMTCRSVVSYFVYKNSCPLHLGKIHFQIFPDILPLKFNSKGWIK